MAVLALPRRINVLITYAVAITDLQNAETATRIKGAAATRNAERTVLAGRTPGTVLQFRYRWRRVSHPPMAAPIA